MQYKSPRLCATATQKNLWRVDMSFKMTFRWYGETDKVTLGHIRQIPCVSGIVSAIYDTPVGEVWSNESIAAMKTSTLKA